MELYKEIIFTEIGRLIVSLFDISEIDVIKVVDLKSLQALQKIKTIINDNQLSDFECIESIILVFEEMGSNGGNRHNFG